MSCLVVSTRGIKAQHRHLLRDLLQLLPHCRRGGKVSSDDGLSLIVEACEEAHCGTALLLDARDPRRLYLWAANCPDGPSAMFRVANVHTIAELRLEARSARGARSVLTFDPGFGASADRRVLRALLTRVLLRRGW